MTAVWDQWPLKLCCVLLSALLVAAAALLAQPGSDRPPAEWRVPLDDAWEPEREVC